MIDRSRITNPILRLKDNLRDPSVFKGPDSYTLFYTRYEVGDWNLACNWSVACCSTRDFVTFTDHRDITAKNYASPGDVVWWHGRWVLPFQSYPERPQRLFFMESSDVIHWSEPRPFLDGVLSLPWNTDARAIDPTFVVDGEELHCFFVGSDGLGTLRRANLLGHAVTRDPALQDWKILSVDAPLMGRDRAPDGVENVVVYRVGGRWIMMFSEGMENQHLASAYDKAEAYCHAVRQFSASPGNFAGGLTTIEEKSMGAFCKSGSQPIQGVIKVAQQPPRPGLWLMDSVPDAHFMQFGYTNPNDSEGIMDLISGGAQIVLFVTGRGSVIGSPVAPLIKITGNAQTYQRMSEDMDFDASPVLTDGESLDSAADRLLDLIRSVASGQASKPEALGHREYFLMYKHQDTPGLMEGCRA